jgi:FAD/FMN-containing dehydrogenase
MSIYTIDQWRRATGVGNGIGRRRFLGSTLGAMCAALPASHLWADASSPGAIPQQLAAITLDGKPVALTASDIKDFRASLKGQLLLAQDPGYDSARRLANPAFDRHPALIARCAGQGDVIQAVNFARTHGLLTAVRGGGHSLSGQSACDGGLMIDLQPMKDIQVDAKQHRAVAQGGVLLGELDRKAQAVGLATTLGTATDTGIAGLTLGGGMGRLMRVHGLSIDNLHSLDIVTADGKHRHASATENPDLFWGLRGGGGNFGVATAFEYQLHPLNHKVLSGLVVYPYSQARSICAAVAELAASAPDELMLGLGIANNSSPQLPGLTVGWAVDYCGDPAVGEKLLEPLRKLGKPLFNTVSAVTYLAAQGAEGAANAAVPNSAPEASNSYTKTGFLYTTPPEVFDELLRRFKALPSALSSYAGLSHMGGAVARKSQSATAFWNRPALYDLLLGGNWTDRSQDQANIRAIREAWAGIEKFTEGYYVNTEPGADDKRVRGTYGGNYARLVQLKDKYDPANLFRLNANIKPTAKT